MIQVKLYLYEAAKEADGYRGKDLSAYVLSGAQNTENLTEELDVSEITLQGYPEREEFAPETKFIVDVYENETIMATYHRVVQEDVVEQPILSDSEYFTHTISLIEPSAIAQKRIVDNIAITYKLKDVNLEVRPDFSAGSIAKMGIDKTAPEPQRGFANYVDSTTWSDTRNTSFGKYFLWKKTDLSNQIKVVYKRASDGVEESTDLYHIDMNNILTESGEKRVKFELPAPHIMWGIKDSGYDNPDYHPSKPAFNGYADIGIASFYCRVLEEKPDGSTRPILATTFISNSNLNDGGQDTDFPYNFAVQSYPNGKTAFTAEYLLEEEKVKYYSSYRPETTGPLEQNVHFFDFYFSRYTDITNGVDYSAQNAYTPYLPVSENCKYIIELQAINIAAPASGMPIVFYPHGTTVFYYNAHTYQSTDRRGFCYIKDKTGLSPYATSVADPADILPQKNVSPNIAYYMYYSDGSTIFLSSGIEYTALNVIKKAIIASDLYYKETNGVSVTDFDSNNPYPFYISKKTQESDVRLLYEQDLAAIRVNETYFRQKNLWEILLEVGKYAHAIPQINFGKDDKFAISFYKLGGTEQRYDGNTRVSVMNFRKIDDYISACSSYIDNLVQLGGQVRELVAPKTTDEDYLVKNDSAKIIVTKPIIELLSVKAIATKAYPNLDYTDKDGVQHTASIAAGESIDITDYIFEKNVYNVLPIEYNEVPNKGIALYYELGGMVINGGDYKLPQTVTNAYTDYSFKKIIFSAALSTQSMYSGYPTNLPTATQGSGPWVDIMINDFVFDVTYRTKDTARVEHTRPDLRHYLLASKHDRVPTHRQFNNQQDILVDSTAFGGSMFGKLIRTGNSNYKVREWCDNIGSIKHKGELYNLDGEWYYVGKVTNIFFPEHIESVVEYSKDYNQLSEIIGIPSEPRFYEISEQSAIDREVAINDYLIVTTERGKVDTGGGLVANLYHTKMLVFGGDDSTYLKWAKTTLKGDPDLDSAEYGTFGVNTLEKEILLPISAYSCGNTLTYEWDMVDNFSAGDKVGEEKVPELYGTADNAYRAMRAVPYSDQYGKATLFDFALFEDLELTSDEIRNLPECPETDIGDAIVTNNEIGKSIVLLKDCREALHFNYNLMMMTDSDTFVISPFFFANNKKDWVVDDSNIISQAKIVLLSEEVNKLSNGYINANTIIFENNDPVILYQGKKIEIDMEWIDSFVPQEIKDMAKAVAVMQAGQSGQTQRFTLAKNGAVYAEDWYIGYPNKSKVFNHYQGGDSEEYSIFDVTVAANEIVSFRYNTENFPVNWGDGTVDNNNYHTYTTAGNYQIKIKGTIKLPDDFEPSSFHTFFDYGVFGDAGSENNSITSAQILSMGINALAYCNNLTSVTFLRNIVTIPSNAFTNCVNLVNIELPNITRIIDSEAFEGCQSLTSLDLKNVRAVGFRGLRYSGLTSVTIPTSCEVIGDRSFEGCNDLTYIRINRRGLLEIGQRAFANIPFNTITLEYDGTAEEWEENVTLGDYWDAGSNINIVYLRQSED